MGKGTYFVYILSNESNTTIYIGVTNSLERRIAEHRSGQIEGFTKRYNLRKLVYVEECGSVQDAIAREKQLKGWKRCKKEELINAVNPQWLDLSME